MLWTRFSKSECFNQIGISVICLGPKITFILFLIFVLKINVSTTMEWREYYFYKMSAEKKCDKILGTDGMLIIKYHTIVYFSIGFLSLFLFLIQVLTILQVLVLPLFFKNSNSLHFSMFHKIAIFKLSILRNFYIPIHQFIYN